MSKKKDGIPLDDFNFWFMLETAEQKFGLHDRLTYCMVYCVIALETLHCNGYRAETAIAEKPGKRIVVCPSHFRFGNTKRKRKFLPFFRAFLEKVSSIENGVFAKAARGTYTAEPAELVGIAHYCIEEIASPVK